MAHLNTRSVLRRGDADVVFVHDVAAEQKFVSEGFATQRRDVMYNGFVMVVNPAKFPHVKADLAQQFADWIVSGAGQTAIASYKIDGKHLFFPNAAR